MLHIIGQMGIGGAETMIMNIYRKIDRSKIQFDFLISTDEECFYEKEILQFGGNVYRTVTKSSHPIRYCQDLWRLIKQNRYPIVHVHASNAMGAIPIVVSKYSGVRKRIIHSHNSNSDGRKVLHYLLRPILNYFSTDKLSCSDLASKWMYATEDNVFVINNPIDCELFMYNKKLRKDVQNELQLKEKITFAHVGRFSKQKNHLFLIDVFECIYKKEPNSILLLIGTGELQNEIEKIVYTRNLSDAVRFLGVRSDVYKVLQACDGFLFPSLYEGLPLTLIEAQASGLICWVSDVITQQVAVTGLIKKISLDRSAEEWADIVLNDFGMPVDRESCNQLVSHKFDSEFIADYMVKKFYKVESN